MVQESKLAVTDSLPFNVVDSVDLLDSLAATEPEITYGLVMDPPPAPPAEHFRPSQTGISFILVGLFILFLIVALRFRNNYKYAGAIFHSLIETRTRHNVFDDTVRETSLLVFLNLLWCVCVGIIVYCVVNSSEMMTLTPDTNAKGMCAWMIAAAAYWVFMASAYSGVGWIFSDKVHTQMWVKGYSASQGLMTPALFIISLIAICWPYNEEWVGLAAFLVFILARMILIWKGYRIFFNQISSWVLFLCYLCSLEIVPLILTYRFGCLLGEEL